MEVVMGKVIRISNELYNRLEVHASGFDSPANVIERILDAFEGITPSSSSSRSSEFKKEIEPAISLDIVYHPDSEEDFKEQLLECKRAYINLYYTNGTSEIKEWNASRFSASSRVDGNLRSGYLRGWKERGIYKAELAISRAEIA